MKKHLTFILIILIYSKIFAQFNPVEFAENFNFYTNGKPAFDTTVIVAQFPELKENEINEFEKLKEKNYPKFVYAITLLNLRLYRENLENCKQSYIVGCGDKKNDYLLYEFNILSENKDCLEYFSEDTTTIIENEEIIEIMEPPVSNYWVYEWVLKNKTLLKYKLIKKEIDKIITIDKKLNQN